MDWIGLAQDRDGWRTLVSAVMNLRIPWNAGNFLTSYKPVSFSRRTLHHTVSKLHTSKKYLPLWYLFEVSVDMFRCFRTLLTLLHIYLFPLTLLSPAKPPDGWLRFEQHPRNRFPCTVVPSGTWTDTGAAAVSLPAYPTVRTHVIFQTERYKEQGFAVNISDCGIDAVCYRHWQINFVIRYSNHAREHAVAHLCYKTEGRGFDMRWSHLNFSGRTKALGSTHPLTEMSTRDISYEVKVAGAYGW